MADIKNSFRIDIGQIFTAHIEDNGLISLKENPEWLFWDGDLIKCRGDDV